MAKKSAVPTAIAAITAPATSSALRRPIGNGEGGGGTDAPLWFDAAGGAARLAESTGREVAGGKLPPGGSGGGTTAPAPSILATAAGRAGITGICSGIFRGGDVVSM